MNNRTKLYFAGWAGFIAFALFLASTLTSCQSDNPAAPPTGTEISEGNLIPGDKLGLIHDPAIFHQQGVTWYEAVGVEVADKYDVLAFQTGEKSKPGNQGNCGSCWAYSTHQAWEIIYAMVTGKALDFSAQTLLSCVSQMGGGSGSCNGGYMTTPEALKKGLPVEREFPYAAADLKCKWTAAEIAKGWDYKAISAPWVGKSLSHSRYWSRSGQVYEDGNKVAAIKAAMIQQKSPAIVTVAAFNVSGSKVYDTFSAINSGGNHMVNITGWDGGIADVYNSWGSSFGVNGIGRIVWEKSPGQLNRGLGVEARVVQYAPPCAPPIAFIEKPKYILFAGSKVGLGKKMEPGVTCRWSPSEGLSDPNACETDAQPARSTEYHLEASNNCGKSSAMTLVEVYVPTKDGREAKMASQTLLTPMGEVSWE